MPTRALRVVADVGFTASADGARSPVAGRISADGALISVDLDTAPSLLALRSRPLARTVAARLTAYGLTVQLAAGGEVLIRLGHGVRAPLWQRLLTGSRHVAFRSVRALLRTRTGPPLLQMALPSVGTGRR